MKKAGTDSAPTFFATPEAWRTWLERHHATETSLIVGFYKTSSLRRSITWPESVDAALCFGWIDGVRKGIDAESYLIRFSPRKPGSIWSAVNIRRVGELLESGLMTPAGNRAFAARSEHKSRIYAYEQPDTARLFVEEEALFRANEAAWEYYEKRASSYRKRTLWWIVSAKQAATRASRLAKLIEASAEKRTL